MSDMPSPSDRNHVAETTSHATDSHAADSGAPRGGTGTRSVPVLGPIRAFRTPVRGHAFASPPPGVAVAEPGIDAELAREPDNPADPLAVAVWASPTSGARWRIGYLDRGVAARLAPRMDAGARVRARLDGWSEEPDGRWRRPLLLLLPDEPAQQRPAADVTGEVRPPAGDPGEQRPTADHAAQQRPAGRAPSRAVSADAPTRVWGRPPGVRRRRVS